MTGITIVRRRFCKQKLYDALRLSLRTIIDDRCDGCEFRPEYPGLNPRETHNRLVPNRAGDMPRCEPDEYGCIFYDALVAGAEAMKPKKANNDAR